VSSRASEDNCAISFQFINQDVVADRKLTHPEVLC
jgi:hypothetical protein